MQGLTREREREASFFKHNVSAKLCFTVSIAFAKITNQNLDWDDFKSFYVLITSSPKLKAYVIETYTNLLEFLVSWEKFKKFKFIPLVGANAHFQLVGNWGHEVLKHNDVDNAT